MPSKISIIAMVIATTITMITLNGCSSSEQYRQVQHEIPNVRPQLRPDNLGE